MFRYDPELFFSRRWGRLPTAVKCTIRCGRHHDFSGRLLLRRRQVRAVLGNPMQVPNSHRNQRCRYQKVLHSKIYGSTA